VGELSISSRSVSFSGASTRGRATAMSVPRSACTKSAHARAVLSTIERVSDASKFTTPASSWGSGSSMRRVICRCRGGMAVAAGPGIFGRFGGVRQACLRRSGARLARQPMQIAAKYRSRPVKRWPFDLAD
jgi:hypothetical protein